MISWGPNNNATDEIKSQTEGKICFEITEPAIKGQHSYSINNSPQKSSTYNLNKYSTIHDRKGHSTEECRAALRSQNENKKTTEETGEEEEEPVTPKSNQKAKVSTNKRGRKTEQESPSFPSPAPKKRVDMILWGPNNNATDEIKNQTEGKIRFEITVAICTLENPDDATLPPSITQDRVGAQNDCAVGIDLRLQFVFVKFSVCTATCVYVEAWLSKR
ncbi:hypothetical protein DY000_02031783 [Brassica cretica]|uniref:Uncharacterized protein n=1 Tax=Brassica cretica TaxID=69181 RepID=A0ABQ7DI57_BRACR|nr:hypothetical protein DY000_02031783 [Brassica cretica]